MPRVPTYEPQVREQGISNARIAPKAPAEVFENSLFSKEVQGGVSDVYKLFEEEKKKADSLKHTELRDTLGKKVEGIRHNALSLKGKNAFGAPEKALADFQKEVAEIQKGAGSPSVKAAFENSVRDI
jgi:hypothetical protein